MLRFSPAVLFIALSFAHAEEPSEKVLSRKEISRQNLEKHRLRLAEDIVALKNRLPEVAGHEWLPQAIETIIRLKEAGDYYAQQGLGKLEHSPDEPEEPLVTLGDTQEYLGTASDTKILQFHQPDKMTEQLLTPGFLSTAPVNVKRIHWDPPGIGFLLRLGDREVDKFIEEHRTIQHDLTQLIGKTIRDWIPGRPHFGRRDPFGEAVASLPDLPYLSRFLYLANKRDREFQNGSIWEMEEKAEKEFDAKPRKSGFRFRTLFGDTKDVFGELEFLAVVLFTPAFQEIYENPEILSPKWKKYYLILEGKEPSESVIEKQLQFQLTLLSKADRERTSEERLRDWGKYQKIVLGHYHSKQFQTRRMAESEAEALKQDHPKFEPESYYKSPFTSHHSVDSFVKALGKTIPETLPESVEYSEPYRTPRFQGDTFSCAVFGVVADMEREGNFPLLSVGLAYGMHSARRVEALHSPLRQSCEIKTRRSGQTLYDFLDRGASTTEVAMNIAENPITTERQFGFSERGWLTEDINRLPDRVFTIKKAHILSNPVTEKALTQILAAGITPVVTHRLSARSIREEWIRIEPLSEIGHVVNVVGYGTAVDPSDLERKTYFVLRDSFTTHAIHYRIASHEFVPLIGNLLKVAEVGLAETPKEYSQELPKPLGPGPGPLPAGVAR